MKILFLIIILVAAISTYLWFNQEKTEEYSVEQSPVLMNEVIEAEKEIVNFSANEFKKLYEEIVLEKRVSLIKPPYITGDNKIDTYIQKHARKRGYKLRFAPTVPLASVNTFKMQQNLQKNWRKLQAKAKRSGIDLKLVSAYRPVSLQRQIFIARANALGILNPSITSGVYDSKLDDLLASTAPPGYSKHHDGYTIDIAHSGYAVFEYSPAFEWIMKNNYKNAKQFGFIPSYPEGASRQGPDPEAWEYVWVGKEYVLQ